MDNDNLHKPKPPKYLMGHRGVRMEGIEENTIEAYQKAIELGANCLETDLRLTKDGVPVISHVLDPHAFSYRNWSEKKEEIIELEDFLTWLRKLNNLNPQQKVNAYLEVKDLEIDMYKVLNLIKDYDLLTDLIIGSRHQEVLMKTLIAKAALEIPPNILPVSYMFTGVVFDPGLFYRAKNISFNNQSGTTYKLDLVHPWFPIFFDWKWNWIRSLTYLSRDNIVQIFAKIGLGVIMGSVGLKGEVAKALLVHLAQIGVVGVTADDPSMFPEVFDYSVPIRRFPGEPPLKNKDSSQSFLQGTKKNRLVSDRSHRLYLEGCEKFVVHQRGPILKVRMLIKFLTNHRSPFD